MANINKIVKVNSLTEAYELNQKRSNVVLGGFMWLKMGNRSFQNAIDLSKLGLDQIEETGDAFSIGCMCTLRDLELHAGLNQAFKGGIREAVHHIIGVQFRNGATVGGSIYGRYGFSDVLTCFMALNTTVELYKAGIMPLTEFAELKYDNDILLRIHIKKDQRRLSYQSQRLSKTDFPLITVAVSKKDDCFYIAVGARPAKARLLVKPGCTLNKNSLEEDIIDFSNWAADQFNYGSNMRGSEDYRRHLAAVYIKRGIKELL
ncbi:FAD binding domain-containing protein [Acetobacterium sp.]|uniref:FAD binding domain-containing protein n=1 Tax=Acetobacterium sp. TaxID=1872094 RepID=UPI002F401948